MTSPHPDIYFYFNLSPSSFVLNTKYKIVKATPLTLMKLRVFRPRTERARLGHASDLLGLCSSMLSETLPTWHAIRKSSALGSRFLSLKTVLKEKNRAMNLRNMFQSRSSYRSFPSVYEANYRGIPEACWLGSHKRNRGEFDSSALDMADRT